MMSLFPGKLYNGFHDLSISHSGLLFFVKLIALIGGAGLSGH